MIPFLRIQGTPNIIIFVNPLEGMRWKVVLKNFLITPLYFSISSWGGCPAKMSEKLLVRPVLHLPVRRVSGGSGTPLACLMAVWICLVSFTESPPKRWVNSIVAMSEQRLITQVVVVGCGFGDPFRWMRLLAFGGGVCAAVGWAGAVLAPLVGALSCTSWWYFSMSWALV